MEIVGNEIVFDGQSVASLKEDVLPSLKGRFEDEINDLEASKAYKTRYVQLVDGLVPPDSLDHILDLVDDLVVMKRKKKRLETIERIKVQIDEVQRNLAYCFDLYNSFR